MTDKFFYANPITEPEDVIPCLAKQERHWKKGYSAYELAHSWVKAKGIPRPVVAVLHQVADFQRMELVEGFFEKNTDLRSRGRPSQTDLLALIGDGDGFAVLGVEGKVDEPFGPLVSEWLVNASPTKQTRLSELRKTLGLTGCDVSNLRYQLLHRTAATIYEAQRYKVRRSVMLVHSFSKNHRWFDDFQAFADAIGTPVSCRNKLSAEIVVEKVSLRLGWVSDQGAELGNEHNQQMG